MDSHTLSSVVQQQLRGLCLNDFPCGHGSWRKSKDSQLGQRSRGYMERDEGREGADKEEQGALIDLLTCPCSPWQHTGSWSPQAAALRKLAVQNPERLDEKYISSYFTTLRIVGKRVSVIDKGLMKFSNLEELVLTANYISELPAGHLPCSLRILELRANRMRDLNGLNRHQLPGLLHLGLGSNDLGSQDDVCHLTGKYWPKLVSLDLSGCDFRDQQALLEALATLPCLRTLLLEGNPFTLALSYPGFTVDSLPWLLYLDASQITPEERHRFRGLAKMRDVLVDRAEATVAVCKVRGIPDPQRRADDSPPDFPVITYSYFVTYEFVGQQSCDNKLTNSDLVFGTVARDYMRAASADTDQQSNRNYDEEISVTSSSKPDAMMMNSQDIAQVPTHSTAKLPWAECMDFTHTSSFIVGDLACFKRFLNRGVLLSLEEEKILSWPAATADTPAAKPSQSAKEKKGGKGKEVPSKAGSKDKSKDKKKKCVAELVQDPPVRRTLGSVHVPLHSLLTGSQRLDVLCDLEKDSVKKIKENKEDEKSESTGDDSAGQKNTAASKGKVKGRRGCEVDVHTDDTASMQLEPVTVEFSVRLEKWQSASEAHNLLPHSDL
ncbi:leucine-rich repeat-containing protein 43-like [Myripristis murdjan]|uniref:leucine-rich repeat-containing protein 43-like n=1 Tax=Myripristis murdjan TaxID=586833 RepID=UPI001175DD3A|nr:leucine-rich repeat-containing protein 43 [Myripristis murdjan]